MSYQTSKRSLFTSGWPYFVIIIVAASRCFSDQPLTIWSTDISAGVVIGWLIRSSTAPADVVWTGLEVQAAEPSRARVQAATAADLK